MAEITKAVIGKNDIVEKILMAVLAGGHVLMEDIPGVGKTTMALAFSRVLSLKENRMQFTPDVMPSDITGFSVFQKAYRRRCCLNHLRPLWVETITYCPPPSWSSGTAC